MSYKTIQFVLVGTNTASVSKVLDNTKNVSTTGFYREMVWYTGTAFDDELDCKTRVDLLRELIQKVQSNPALRKNPDNLVVFVTPEFLFRPASGSYEGKVQMVIDQLMDLVKGSEYGNWLFFFGSVIGNWKNKNDRNVVPIIAGGGIPKLVHTVVKANTSGIDYVESHKLVRGRCPQHNPIPKKLAVECCNKWYPVRTTVLGAVKSMTLEEEGQATVHVRNEVKHKGNIEKHKKEFSLDTQNNFFEHAGVSFCVEVCLDHDCNDSGNGFARTTLQSSHLDNLKTPRTQVHLVTSCGMSINPASVCASPGGLVAICDGISSLTEVSEVSGAYNEFEETPLKSLGSSREEFDSTLPQVVTESTGNNTPPTVVDVDTTVVNGLFETKKLYGRRVRADIYPTRPVPTKEAAWDGN